MLWWNPWWAMMNGIAPMQKNLQKWPLFDEVLIIWLLGIFSNALKHTSQDSVLLTNREKSPMKSTFWHNLEKYCFRVFFEESWGPLRGEWAYIYPWYPRYFKPLPTLWWNPWWAMMNGLAPMQRNTEKWPIFNEILIVWPLKIFSNTLKLKSLDTQDTLNIFSCYGEIHDELRWMV